MFALLQILNYRAMICDPMKFQKYGQWENVTKRVILVLATSVFLSTPQLILLCLEFAGMSHLVEFVDNILHKVEISKMAIIRIVCIFFTVIIAKSIKKALVASREIRNEGDGVRQTPSLYVVVCLVPLFSNVLNFLGDISEAVALAIDTIWGDRYFFSEGCEQSLGYFRITVYMPLIFVTYLTGTVIQCCSYLLLFPKLRKNVCFSFN